jgi:hypothetical protein
VLIVADYSTFNAPFLRELKRECPFIRLILGWCGAPYNDPSVFREWDIVLSCIPEMVEDFRADGHRAVHLNHAFEPRILEKIDLAALKAFAQARSLRLSFNRLCLTITLLPTIILTIGRRKSIFCASFISDSERKAMPPLLVRASAVLFFLLDYRSTQQSPVVKEMYASSKRISEHSRSANRRCRCRIFAVARAAAGLCTFFLCVRL